MLTKLCKSYENCVSKLTFVPELLSRFVIGYIFAEAGYGKLTHLPKVIEYFTSLGIPAANIQAPFVASLEFLCGTCLLLGICVRSFAIPPIGIMVVALITAKKDDITDFSSFLSTSEFLYIVVLSWLVVYGGGKFGVSALMSRRHSKA